MPIGQKGFSNGNSVGHAAASPATERYSQGDKRTKQQKAAVENRAKGTKAKVTGARQRKADEERIKEVCALVLTSVLTVSRAQLCEERIFDPQVAVDVLGLAAVLGPEAPFYLPGDEKREVRAILATVSVHERRCACSSVRRSSSRGDCRSVNGLSRYPRSGAWRIRITRVLPQGTSANGLHQANVDPDPNLNSICCARMPRVRVVRTARSHTAEPWGVHFQREERSRTYCDARVLRVPHTSMLPSTRLSSARATATASA